MASNDLYVPTFYLYLREGGQIRCSWSEVICLRQDTFRKVGYRVVTWNRGWLGERVVSDCVGGPTGPECAH